ncbi:hypothetical protein OIU77_006956 [Salix suchowensis]|uniref:Uncharacterized protein n=1 Tax=Salix suchowensis TaxID=1278906 RepID=A0ABQ9AMI4_9ROSI|nr:hypothetical protein OIU77_006956 [Salix suchowensis]
MEMQSQQRLFSVKRQAPQRRQLSTVGGRGRGRGRGSTPYFDPRFTDEEPYTFQATEKISLGDVELFNLQGCGVEYRVPEGHTPNKTQKIILDNLWYSVKQKDLAHFKAAMEALSSYFMQEQDASSSSATCQNCKTYRGQIAELIDQIDNKDEQDPISARTDHGARSPSRHPQISTTGNAATAAAVAAKPHAAAETSSPSSRRSRPIKADRNLGLEDRATDNGASTESQVLAIHARPSPEAVPSQTIRPQRFRNLRV